MCNEHGHGDGGLQESSGAVLVVEAVEGVVVCILFGDEVVVASLYTVGACVSILHTAQGW